MQKLDSSQSSFSNHQTNTAVKFLTKNTNSSKRSLNCYYPKIPCLFQDVSVRWLHLNLAKNSSC